MGQSALRAVADEVISGSGPPAVAALLDEAHYFLAADDIPQSIDPELAGYIFVTYRVSSLPKALRQSTDTVVLVTRERDPAEAATLLGLCRPCSGVSTRAFHELQMTEAALLPPAVRPSTVNTNAWVSATGMSRYLVRWRTCAVRRGARARTLKEFSGLLLGLGEERLLGHVRRHDFSRWIDEVFRDRPFAAFVRGVESRLDAREDVRDIADTIAQAVRARYESALDPSAGSAVPIDGSLSWA